MNNLRSILLMILSLWILLFSTSALAAIDPTADKVSLRTSCTVNNNALDDCFTNWWTLYSWISTTRLPNANGPLEVDIGPGTFGPNVAAGFTGITVSCNPSKGFTGYISFVGAGSNQTILTGQGTGNSSPFNVFSCTNLNFSHLQISSLNTYGAVEWNGGGISHWDDVQLNGIGRAWYEGTCGATPGEHTWNNSQVTAIAAFDVADTYQASCDESQFYGSDITVEVPSSVTAFTGPGAAVVAVASTGIIHLYGSHLVAQIDGGGAQSNYVSAALATNGGMIHIHGTGIDVISNDGMNITALAAGSGGMIHAPASAYYMSTTGIETRIHNGGGMIMAPYLWPEGATPPAVVSANGSDQVVITATSDGHPHLLVYDNTCPSAWYDTVLRVCH